MDKSISSGLKTTFLIHCIVAVVFGLIFLFVPQVWGNLAGVQIKEHNMYRMLGAAILALGLSSWLAFQATKWESVRILVLTEILWTALGAAITLYYLFRWSYPPLYWLIAILMVGFAVLFTVFYFQNK
jgi:uncharacterized protein YjeT (DUF2065 family)